MSFKKINKILSSNHKYKQFKKPLEAAEICDIANQCIKTRKTIISFNRGLLTVAVKSAYEAAEMQMKAQDIIDDINSKTGQNKVERIRFKIQ